MQIDDAWLGAVSAAGGVLLTLVAAGIRRQFAAGQTAARIAALEALEAQAAPAGELAMVVQRVGEIGPRVHAHGNEIAALIERVAAIADEVGDVERAARDRENLLMERCERLEDRMALFEARRGHTPGNGSG